jgi:gp16 family phage-associated protein
MTKKHLKTRQEARIELIRTGISVSQWARTHGFTPSQVREVLRNDFPCKFGVSHKIAVLLGIKDGVILSD